MEVRDATPPREHAIQAAIGWALEHLDEPTPKNLIDFLCPPPTYSPAEVREVLSSLLYMGRLRMETNRHLRWADLDAERHGAERHAADAMEAMREASADEPF